MAQECQFYKFIRNKVFLKLIETIEFIVEQIQDINSINLRNYLFNSSLESVRKTPGTRWVR